jgi:hypothetical protein
MTRSHRRTVLGAGLVVATALAGCSSSGNGGNTTSPGGPTSSAGGTSANSATTKAITKAYRLFFDSTGPTKQGVANLQHGAKFRSTIIGESQSSYGKQKTSASVSAVRIVKPKVADVTFSIKVGGQTLLPNSHGYAVREGGRWKVATQTFCALLKLEDTAPALCKQKSITALPG